MKKDKAKDAAEARVMRVFVSSTFRDMHAERDELAKFIFPQLRKLCEQRGVTWGEVDLRWGITDEQRKKGEVLEICLKEIQRCRPYFIGLLGERSGSLADEISQELVESEPWLDEYHNHSITELEILHGVLNNPQMADHAYFYFRSPSYIDSLPVEHQPAYRETPIPKEIEENGRDEAQRRADERKRKLVALKNRIRASGLPVRENYGDPRALGELVLRDLTAVINRLYPEGKQPDPLDREAAKHEAFAKSRVGVYIGRQEYFDRLDEHARGDGPPLVVTGESGMGKSALLANWVIRYRENFPKLPTALKESFWTKLIDTLRPTSPSRSQPLILMHFIGATPDSADWMTMLQRIMSEFKRRFDIREEIPTKPDALRAAFANWLHMAAAKGRVVLILDALNQLEDRYGAPDLIWLPPVIPANVRMIFSTLPGRPLDELNKRGWQTLRVEPLTPDERKQLIEAYLSQYTKALNPERIERIAGTSQAANPLYIRALLEELRVFGIHEQLDKRIKHYLAAETIDALYERILARYETDYERDHPGLVREAMSLLWAARRGLSEAELLDLLGANGQRLQHAYWSPLYLAAEAGMVNRDGLIGFFHDYLRQAVERRYLLKEKSQRKVHLRLADYFAGQKMMRKVDELPWQLTQAGSWGRLNALLTDLTFFKAAWDEKAFELLAYWAQMENNTNLRMVSGFQKVLDAPSAYDPDVLLRISKLMWDAGHPDEAIPLNEYLSEQYRRIGDREGLRVALGYQAVVLNARGDLDGAMVLHKEEERLCLELGNKDGLQASLGNQAIILKNLGNLDGAMVLFKKQERLCRELGNKSGLQPSLGNQANIHYDRGDMKRALELHKEEERLCREVGNKAGLQASLGNHANILHAMGNLDGAMALHKEKERICRELGDKAGLGRSLGNQGSILSIWGHLDEAMELHKEEERLSLELGNKDGLQASLGYQAMILFERDNNLEGAMKLLKKQERICRDLGKKHDLAVSIHNQSAILTAQNNLDGTMVLLKEAECLFRELGDKKGQALTLGNQAQIIGMGGNQLQKALVLVNEAYRLSTESGYASLPQEIETIRAEIRKHLIGNSQGPEVSLEDRADILYAQGNLKEALALYKQQELLSLELNLKSGLQRSLGRQGAVLEAWGDLKGAMALYRKQELLCHELDDIASLEDSIGNQGNILYHLDDLDGAMALYKEQERLCRELGDKQALSYCLGNQANVFYARGKDEIALKLYKEQERICREQGVLDGLQLSLGNQGVSLKAQGNLDGALVLFREQERLCRVHGFKRGLALSLGNQGLVLKEKGDVSGAKTLFKEQKRLYREMNKK